MTKRFLARIAPAALSALALSACAAPAYVSPVEVTRFVGNAPASLQGGAIAVQPAGGQETRSLEYGIYEEAVRQALARQGFSVASGSGPLVALVSVDNAVKQAGYGRRSPVSVGGGASTGSYGSGVGVGVGIDLGSLAGPPPDEIDTQLSVSIRPAEGDEALWEGRALMTATTNSDYADPAAAAQRLADALFQDFPGNDGETIEVR